jgi:hypothetical protein
MADLRDYTKKNPIFVGTDGIRLPIGTGAQKGASSNVAGTLRYNTDISSIEFFTPSGWIPLGAPPAITTVTPSTFNGTSGSEFTINGSNFSSDVQVYFVTSNGTNILASTVTYIGNSQLKATTPRNITVQEEPISVKVNQPSGIFTKPDCIDAGGLPSWITTAGTLGSIFGANTVNVYVSATDPEGSSISYQITSGSLPAGLSLTSANGLVQGLASSVLANTTYNFTIKANDTATNNTDRAFSYTVLNRAPVINTAAGSLGTIYSGNAASATISAYDPDGGSITFAVASGSLPANSSLGTANGVIQGTPILVTTNTTYTFSISTTDEGSLSASNTYTYTVLNRPPLWNTNPTLTTINGADPYTPITINAYDPDGASITYSLTSGAVPSGLTFVTANATLTGTPDEVESNTTSTFVVTATDVGSDANARTFSLTVTPIVDAQFSNTVLLLHGDGNTSIRDASSDNRPLTVFGDVKTTNFSPFSNTAYGSYSGNFGMAAGNLYYPDSDAYTLGSADFAIEFWWYPTNISSETDMFGQWSSGGNDESWLIHCRSSTFGLSYVTDGSSDIYVESGTKPTLGRWNHIVVCRNSNTISIFIDGVRTATGSESGAISNSTRVWCVGGRGGSSYGRINGMISDFRIVKGNGLSPYNATSSTLTVPTAPLQDIAGTSFHIFNRARGFTDTITGNIPTVVDAVLLTAKSPFGNTEADTTTGSMYFDGSGDYLSLGAPYNFGSNNFTVEGWFYLTTISGTQSLWGSSNGGGGQSKLQVYVSSGNITLDFNGSAVVAATAATYLVPGTWNHVAYCRGGTGSNQTAVFINGVRAAVGTLGSQTGITDHFKIGNSEAGVIAASYISNFRIVDGTDVYGYTNTTYTVPTTPLTNITNTKLLTLQNRQPHNNHGFIDSSRTKSLITRNGNPSQGTFTPFSADSGKWSAYFNGSSGVRFPDSSVFSMGTNPFTIEAWVYVTKTQGAGYSIISQWIDGNDSNSSWMIGFNWGGGSGGSKFEGTISIGGSVTSVTDTVDCTLNTWNHVVLSRSGSPGTLALFVNGVRKATATPTGSLIDATNSVGIGIRGGTNGYYADGVYISNARVVNGTDVYGATNTSFTVPTTPLTAITNTSLLTCQDNQYKDNSPNGLTSTTVSIPQVKAFSPFAPNNKYSTANTGGSIYLDGSGDHLYVGHPIDFYLGNNSSGYDFSFECWYYTTTAAFQGLLSKRTGGVASGWEFATSGMYGDLNGTWRDSNSIVGEGAGTYTSQKYGQWTHICYTRSGTNVRMFINGKLTYVKTDISGYIQQLTDKYLTIGANGANGGNENLFNGYISSMRFCIESIPTGYQTASTTAGTQIFTPPTAPVTLTSQGALANSVVMLTNFNNAAIVDSTAKTILETTGEAKVNNSIYKYGTGALTFDGTGDSLLFHNPIDFAFGIGDFTAELWLYPVSWDSNMVVLMGYSSTGFGIQRYGGASNLGIIINGSWVLTDATLPSTGQWTHIAVTRTSGTLRFFVNGVVSGSTPSNTSDISGGMYGVAGYSGQTYFNGHMEDIRITKGSSRYTTTFTPPTRGYPDK